MLTAKKIAKILNVSLDELVSGEELKENIERKPVLAQPIENIVQTVLYTAAAIVYFIATAIGLILSVKNRLTAKITGYIMCVPYVLASFSFLMMYINMKINNNGYIDIIGWFTGFVVPLVFAICIILFFRLKERRIPLGIIVGICVLTIGYLAYGYKNRITNFTELGFVITTVNMAGKTGMTALLAYQAYVWDKKKKIAYKVLK